MTKRTKLLSLIVAAALCLVAGFTMMFSSTAKADVVVPTVSYSDQRVDLDWSTGKNFDGIGIGYRAGVSTDWAVLEYYVPAGATRTSAASITFALSASDVSTLGDEADGSLAKTTYAVAADSAYVSNATEQDVKVVLAIDIVNGKVYGSVADAAFEEIATFANIAYVSSAEVLRPYWQIPANSLKRLNNVKLYTEDGIINDIKAGNAGNYYQGAAAFNADKITSINYPSGLVKPSASNVYAASGSIKMMNTTPTASDWIFMEYTVSAATVAAAGADPNAFMTVLSNNGHQGHAPSSANENYVGVLHNNVSTYVQGEMRNLFTPVDEADTDVKIAINTKTGLMATYINGELYQSKHQYAEAANLTGADRYYYIGSNSSSVSGVLKNVVVYDGNGIDLGLTTNMVEVAPEVDASDIEGATYSAQSSFWFANKTATTSKWIFLEWTNDEGNTTARTGGGWTWGVAIGDQSLNGVTATDANIWHDFGTTYLGAETAGKDIKVAVNTETGEIAVYVDGLARESSTRSVAGLSNFKFRTGANSSYVYNSTVYGLKAYDENGNDLGIETNMITTGTIKEDYYTLTAHGGFMRFQGDVSFVTSTGDACAPASIGANLNVLKDGTEAATISFVTGGGTLQLFYPNDNGWTADEWTWSDFNNELYVVEEGTLFGCVYLTEDIYIVIHNTIMCIFKADAEFAITYEGAAAGTNPTAYTYGTDDATALADPETVAGKLFAGWYVNTVKVETLADISNAAAAGDVIVTAKYVDLASFDGIFTMSAQGYDTENRFLHGFDKFILKGSEGQDVAVNQHIGELAVIDSEGNPATINISYTETYHLINDFTQFGIEARGDIATIPLQWYTIPANTVLGNVMLTEDTIIRVKGSSLTFFSASYEFDINYEGAEAGSNPTAFDYGDAEFDLEDAAAVPGKTFVGWFLNGAKVESINPIDYIDAITLVAKYVTNVTIKDMATFAGQSNFNRYQGTAEEIIFTDGTIDIPAAFQFGTVALYDLEGEFVRDAQFAYDGTYQMLGVAELGFTALADVTNSAYLIKAGTILGDYILTEDVILWVSNSSAALMPADQTFDITYENLRDATNGNAATYSLETGVTLTAISKQGLEFVGWYIGAEEVTEIAFPAFFGDVTVRAVWKEAKFVSYNAKISADGSVEVYAYAVVDGYDNFTADAPYVFDSAKGMYKFTTAYNFVSGDTVTLTINDGSAQQIATATIDIMAYLNGLLAGDDITAEVKAIVADYIAYARALKAMMPGGAAYVAPAGATAVPTYTTPGSGEIGMKDAANYWNVEEMVFVTTATENVELEVNGEKLSVEVDEGEINITTLFMGDFAFNPAVIGAKLTIKVFCDDVQIGNTLVLNYAAFVLEMADQFPAEEADELLVFERAICFYNSFAAYLAD